MKKSRLLWTGFISGIFLFAAGFSRADDPPTIYVTFWFDTEDYILPQADDAAKRLAEMFTKRHVKATFKVVGEKANVLEERGRSDVILALAQNDIGYHSTLHSVHPTPSEYTRDLDWSEGVSEFERREGVGLESVRHIFGVNPSCYGQPGGSWTSQSYAALRDFDIPVYLDATNHVNLNDRPFWFDGILTVLEMGDCVMRTGWTDEAVKEACTVFDRVHQKLTQEGGGLISIYYHPCEFVHQNFWDGVNFAKGANPPRSEWKLPPMKSPEEQEQAFNAFETYLDHIVNHPAVRLVTARELPTLYSDRSYTHFITRDDVLSIAKTFQQHLTYADLGDRMVSAGEGLLALSQYIAEIDGDQPPDSVELQFAYGPSSVPQQFITQGKFRWDVVQSAAKELNEIVTNSEQLPTIVWVDGQPVRPEDFAVTLASVVVSGSVPDEVTLRQGELEAKKFVADDSPNLWGWVIFPEGFHAPKLMEIAKLQAWTIKPAVLRK